MVSAGSVRSLEAVDFSAEMIAQAQKRSASVRLRDSVEDATRLPYVNQFFDAVLGHEGDARLH